MKQYRKDEIKVYKGKWTCFVMGPTAVCDQLLDMGARRTNRNGRNGLSDKSWSFPIAEYDRLLAWHDALPEVIEVDKRPEHKKRATEIGALSAIKVGDVVRVSYGENRVRAFEAVEVARDGRAIVREIEIVDGVPQKGKWVYIEYEIAPGKYVIDGRDVVPCYYSL